MTNKEQVIDFLSYLADWTKLQFSKNCNQVVSAWEAFWKEWMYFVWWMDSPTWSWKWWRAEDSDIIMKNYVWIDIDIRNHFLEHWDLIDQETLRKEINEIRAQLMISWLSDYCAIVDSGNGCHIYYRWKGKKFDVLEYSESVKWLMIRIDFALRDLWYKTDHACSNLSRLLRLPWSINPRKKPEKKKMQGFDLWPIECEILYFEKENSETFNNLSDFRELYLKSKEEEKESEKKIISDAREYRSESDWLRWEINSIDVSEIANKVWWVTKGDSNWPFTTLVESHKNMWAFIINQFNIVKNQWSSLITTNRETFTVFDIVCYELMGWNTKDTLQRFVDNYHINPQKYADSAEKVKRSRVFNRIWYRYPWDYLCEEFWSLVSWEIVLIAAPTNVGKTSMGVSILRENLDKKAALLNMEFDISDTYRFQFLRSKWYKDSQLKAVWTNLMPIDESLKNEIDAFVDKKMSDIPTFTMHQDVPIDDVMVKLDEMIGKWYSMIMVDSLSSIKWWNTNEWQELIMKYFRNFATDTWVCLLVIHHFNKSWKTESGSQKISDLSNVVLHMFPAEDWNWWKYRVIVLKKDKAHSDRVICHIRQAIWWWYDPVDNRDQEAQKPERLGK